MTNCHHSSHLWSSYSWAIQVRRSTLTNTERIIYTWTIYGITTITVTSFVLIVKRGSYSFPSTMSIVNNYQKVWQEHRSITFITMDYINHQLLQWGWICRIISCCCDTRYIFLTKCSPKDFTCCTVLINITPILFAPKGPNRAVLTPSCAHISRYLWAIFSRNHRGIRKRNIIVTSYYPSIRALSLLYLQSVLVAVLTARPGNPTPLRGSASLLSALRRFSGTTPPMIVDKHVFINLGFKEFSHTSFPIVHLNSCSWVK